MEKSVCTSVVPINWSQWLMQKKWPWKHQKGGEYQDDQQTWQRWFEECIAEFQLRREALLTIAASSLLPPLPVSKFPFFLLLLLPVFNFDTDYMPCFVFMYDLSLYVYIYVNRDGFRNLLLKGSTGTVIYYYKWENKSLFIYI